MHMRHYIIIKTLEVFYMKEKKSKNSENKDNKSESGCGCGLH